MVLLYRNCKGDAPTTFMKCGIKKRFWDANPHFLKRELVEYVPSSNKDFCILNTIFIKKLLEVASEVVVHRITQVGRIRAENKRILISL